MDDDDDFLTTSYHELSQVEKKNEVPVSSQEDILNLTHRVAPPGPLEGAKDNTTQSNTQDSPSKKKSGWITPKKKRGWISARSGGEQHDTSPPASAPQVSQPPEPVPHHLTPAHKQRTESQAQYAEYYCKMKEEIAREKRRREEQNDQAREGKEKEEDGETTYQKGESADTSIMALTKSHDDLGPAFMHDLPHSSPQLKLVELKRFMKEKARACQLCADILTRYPTLN